MVVFPFQVTYVVKMAAEGVEVDSVQIIGNKKSEEASLSVTNTRLVIDLYRDTPVLYDKKCKDYGNHVATKKVLVNLKI